MVKVAFATQAPHAPDPARVLSGLNRALCGALEGTYAGDPADGLADRILRGLAEWRGGGRATDDLTLLVLDILG